MADEADLELESEGDNTGSIAKNVKKQISIKLKSAPKAQRGRPRKGSKNARAKKEEIPEKQEPEEPTVDGEIIEAPIFKQPAREPVHQSQHLQWNHKVNLIGEKVVDPLVHCCEKCMLPILIYGRMIPCKHVFCFDCAKKTEKTCSRCEEPVQRIEQSALGTVFICTFESTKHGTNGCRRTYLSQRDLQAHILHRHVKPAEAAAAKLASEAAGHGSSGSSHSDRDRERDRQSLEPYSTSSSKNKPTLSQIEQYTTAAGRHSGVDMQRGISQSAMTQSVMTQGGMTQSGMNQRPVGEDGMFRTGAEDPRLSHVMSHLPPQSQAVPSQHGNVLASTQPATMMPRMPLSTSQPPPNMPPLQQTATSHDAYQMPGMPLPPGRTNLITVQLHDDTDYRRHDPYMAQQAGNVPAVSFSTSVPPPGHRPPLPTTAMLQGPPPVSYATPMNSVGPSLFSSPPPTTVPNAPITHPPPGPVPPPRVNAPPVSLHGNLGVPPPQRMNIPGPIPGGQPPPRFPNPYEDNPQNTAFGQPPPGGQNPRVPWTGPPQRPPPPRPGTAPMHPPPQRPQSDYGQFY